MHFILTNNLINNEQWSLEQIAGLEKLSCSVFYGNHILTIESPRVADKLLSIGNEKFGSTTIGVIKKCLSQYSLQGAILQNIKTHRKVVFKKPENGTLSKLQEYIFLEELGKISLEPTVILSENIIDSHIYAHAGKHAIVEKKLKNVNLKFNTRGGNGEGIYVEFEAIAKDNPQFCLTITDGDYNYPGKADSDKSIKCAQIATQYSKTTKHLILPVREIENLIPPNIWQEIIESPEMHKLEQYQLLINKNPSIRIHGDIKDGITYKKLMDFDDSSPEKKYIESFINEKELHDACHKECKKNGNCGCMIIPKLGNNISIKFRNWFNEKTPHKSLEYFSKEWRDTWMEIGEDILEWCCASPVIRK